MSTSVTTQDFVHEVLEASSEKPVLVDFWAAWCGPCRQVSPIIDQIGEENADRVKVVKVNIDEEPELAQKYRIQSIPNLVLFKDGKDVVEFLGAAPKSVILGAFDSHL